MRIPIDPVPSSCETQTLVRSRRPTSPRDRASPRLSLSDGLTNRHEPPMRLADLLLNKADVEAGRGLDGSVPRTTARRHMLPNTARPMQAGCRTGQAVAAVAVQQAARPRPRWRRLSCRRCDTAAPAVPWMLQHGAPRVGLLPPARNDAAACVSDVDLGHARQPRPPCPLRVPGQARANASQSELACPHGQRTHPHVSKTEPAPTRRGPRGRGRACQAAQPAAATHACVPRRWTALRRIRRLRPTPRPGRYERFSTMGSWVRLGRGRASYVTACRAPHWAHCLSSCDTTTRWAGQQPRGTRLAPFPTS